MPREQNIRNLNTEKAGIRFLRSKIENFMVPTPDEKRFLYDILGIDYQKYSRSIDGVILNVGSIDKVKSKKDFSLIEIKTTRSRSVRKLPYGVFFGFTKNEEDLFRSIENYRLCIVHTVLEEYILLSYPEYKSLIQNKRIQYQISFRSN
jgi:hypothetical protein